jgi:hypothetical protein
VSLSPIRQERVANPNEGKVTTVSNGAGVQARNTIHVAMEDLTEEDQKELERELEEEMAERQCKKLACFQKTRHGVVKKADTADASGPR